MARRGNIIEFGRSFQEAFQRQQQIEIQRQREERFDRQLTANAGFRQADLNIKRQQLDLQERQFERGPQGSFGAVQLGSQTGVINRRTGEISETAFPSARVAGDTGDTFSPGKFGIATQLKEAGLTGTAVTEAIQNIPIGFNREEAEGFLLGGDPSVVPFLRQESPLTFGLAKGFGAQPFTKNASQTEIEPIFKKFLQDTDFAGKTPDQQRGILAAFESSLGKERLDIEGGKNVVPRDEVDFDLQSEFFQKIIEAEGGKSLQPTQGTNLLQKALDENKITQNEFDSINRGIQAGTITSDQVFERIK